MKKRPVDYRAALVLAAAMADASMLSGCMTHLDEDGSAEHHWNARENTAYRHYLADQHLEYREFSSLTPPEQRAYGEWRDHHSG
jgi:hypothetical protein